MENCTEPKIEFVLITGSDGKLHKLKSIKPAENEDGFIAEYEDEPFTTEKK